MVSKQWSKQSILSLMIKMKNWVILLSVKEVEHLDKKLNLKNSYQ